jgi:hypothetical protein
MTHTEPDSTAATAEPLRLAAAGDGLALHFEGLRLLRRERGLWKLAFIPFLIALVACTLTGALLVAYLDVVHGLATAWLPQFEVGAWWHWLWVGPARALFFLLGIVLTAILAGFSLVMAFLVANVLSSPFLDAR